MKKFTLKNLENQDFFGYCEDNEIAIDVHWLADSKEEAIQVAKTLLRYVENA
jgi:hypothetical protein